MKEKGITFIHAVVLSLKTVWKIDNLRVFYEIFYNLIKQFFNVFYGVYFLRTILVYIETGREFTSIFLLLLFMLAVNVVFYLVNNYFKEVYLPRFDIKLSQSVYEKTVVCASHVPYDRYNRPEFLDQYKRVLDNTVPNMQKVLSSLGTMCGLVLALLMVAVYVVQVDLFAILLSIFPLIYSYFISEKSEKYQFRLNQKITLSERKKDYARRVFYLPQYAKELKMTSISKAVEDIYDEGASEKVHQYKKLGKPIAFLRFIELCIGDVFIIMLPVAYVAVRMVTGASFMIGDFIGIAQSITYFSWDLEWFFDMLTDIKSASFYIGEYVDYMKEYSLDGNDKISSGQQEDQASPALPLPFLLECKDAAYAYPGAPEGKYALHDINLTIRQGEKVAVVGENGAGKTTLVYLLMNLLSATEGTVRLNGRDLNDFAPGQLKNFFGVLLQDFHLYPLSVRENICINGPLEDAALWSAIEKVGLKEKIPDLDCLFTKEFSDDGLELSGGQRQKLALTRVIANDFPFIILDEPTSALDPLAEQEIYRLIFQAAADKTLLFISHRLSTTRFVDRILVLKDGAIVEEGSHQQLMEAKGYYHYLYTLQENMYKERAL